jgi:hypothetical protein
LIHSLRLRCLAAPLREKSSGAIRTLNGASQQTLNMYSVAGGQKEKALNNKMLRAEGIL